MKTEKAIFAGGCFWCTEAVFQNLKGVSNVISGYIGGTVQNPSYDQVSMGKTGHTEAIEIEFDPSVISYKELLYVFFYTHNPTTINQQGADIGTQYRSAIFYNSNDQKDMISLVMEELKNEGIYNTDIVTEVNPAEKFYLAETYHQNYFNQNKEKTYCQIVIFPKIEKLKSKFSHLLKDDRAI
jgi:peptide-methionine (S)-S-oxide reductase